MRLLPLAIALSTVTHLYSQETQQSADPDSQKTHPSPERLKEMIVQGMKPSAYGQPAATSITGLPAPIKELPVTVNTISAQFLDDTSALRLRDIVGYVPGVNASEDSGATGDLLNIRGFDFIYQTYINGMRNRTGFNASRRFDTIDRVEIFKGPGGVEFGAGDPGGFVNMVTKKPQETQSTTTGFEAGSYDLIRAFVDTTGPLSTHATATAGDPKSGIPANTDDLGLFYRLIASGDSANSFRDAFHTDGYEIAPSLLWKYAPGSSVLVEFDYQFRDQPYDRGILYIEGAGFKDNFEPINTSFHEPDDYYNNTNTRTSVYWTNKINDTFTFRTTAELDTNRGRGVGVRSPYTFLLYKDGTNEWNGDTSILRTTQNIQQDIWSVGIKPELLLNFDTGPVKNTGLLGFDYTHTSTKTASQDGFDLRPISFPVPVHGQPHSPNDSFPSIVRNFRFSEELDEYGLYYQHKADFGSNLHLLGGIRYDWYDDDTGSSRNVSNNPVLPLYSISDGNLSYRIGGVIDLTKSVSLFAGYSDSFQPQSGVLPDNSAPDALEATAWEAGVKASFLNNRLQTTLSVYDTVRKNILEADLNDPTGTFVIPLGTVEVRGIEFEATGKLTDDLDLQGGLALMDTEITDTEDATTYGNRFINVPKFQAGIRLRYDTSRWLVKGFSVGAGAVYVGSREGDAANTFQLPEYLRYDAGLYYTWRNFDFKLTCENIGDTRYYLASQGEADIIQPGAPRMFTLGAKMKF